MTRSRIAPVLAALALLALALPGCIHTTATQNQTALPFTSTPNFETDPFWDGTTGGDYGTGLALADLNGDNYPDLIVASGNDKALQQVQVFYNDKTGHFPKKPDWHSTDAPLPDQPGEHNALVAVGDIDGNGYNDVAVSIFLGPKNEYDKGGAKVYFNYGGRLESTASWRVTGFPSFGLDLADADGDGDLDLAVACGEPIPSEEVWATQPCDAGARRTGRRTAAHAPAPAATQNPDPPYKVRNRIYYNEGGALATTPGWLSDDAFVAMGCIFADANGDGLMDIVFDSAPVRVYLGQNDGTIATTPGWTSNDVNYYGNGIDFARTMHASTALHPDDVATIATSSSNYIGNGRGGFSLYRFLDPYIIQYAPHSSYPDWQSAHGGWGSAIHFTDLTNDGNLDVLTHRWNDPGRNDLDGTLLFYLGDDATLSDTPAWTTTAVSVIESIQTSDLDQRALQLHKEPVSINAAYVNRYWKPGQDHQNFLYTQQQGPIHVVSVLRNGRQLRETEYLTVPGRNWVAFKNPLKQGDAVVIAYFASPVPDIVYTNWNCNKGNYIYYNQN